MLVTFERRTKDKGVVCFGIAAYKLGHLEEQLTINVQRRSCHSHRSGTGGPTGLQTSARVEGPGARVAERRGGRGLWCHLRHDRQVDAGVLREGLGTSSRCDAIYWFTVVVHCKASC